MNHMSISIDGYNRSYTTKTIDSLGREIYTYWKSDSTVPERQDVYNPMTGEHMYLLGGCTVK